MRIGRTHLGGKMAWLEVKHLASFLQVKLKQNGAILLQCYLEGAEERGDSAKATFDL